MNAVDYAMNHSRPPPVIFSTMEKKRKHEVLATIRNVYGSGTSESQKQTLKSILLQCYIHSVHLSFANDLTK